MSVPTRRRGNQSVALLVPLEAQTSLEHAPPGLNVALRVYQATASASAPCPGPVSCLGAEHEQGKIPCFPPFLKCC